PIGAQCTAIAHPYRGGSRRWKELASVAKHAALLHILREGNVLAHALFEACITGLQLLGLHIAEDHEIAHRVLLLFGVVDCGRHIHCMDETRNPRSTRSFEKSECRPQRLECETPLRHKASRT